MQPCCLADGTDQIGLVAVTDTDSTFSGWSGAGCSGTSPCFPPVNSPATVTATFERKPVSVTVSKTGAGSGLVTSSPAGINCGATSADAFAVGETAALTATPASGSAFTGWSGSCGGTTSCVLHLTGAASVSAAFVPVSPFHVDQSVSFWNDANGVRDQLRAAGPIFFSTRTGSNGVQSFTQHGTLGLTLVAAGQPGPETVQISLATLQRGLDPQKPDEFSGTASAARAGGTTVLNISGGLDTTDGSIGLVFQQGAGPAGFLRLVP